MKLCNIDTYQFKGPTKEFHYNGSIIEWEGEYLFAWRRDIYNNDFKIPSAIGWNRKYGNEATISICRLRKRDFAPIPGSERRILLPDTTKCGNRFEDPRLFNYRGKLGCSFINVSKKFSSAAQGVCEIEYSCKNKVIVPKNIQYPHYGKNTNAALIDEQVVMHPQQYLTTFRAPMTFEKNWTFFSWRNKPYFVYSINPQIVVHMNPTFKRTIYSEIQEYNFSHWTWGELRGGTPPYLHEGKYWSFFHSSFNIPEFREKIYAMGVYTFEPNPPFKILEISQKPLLTGDLKFKKVKNKIPCVFPAGAVRLKNKWAVSLGYHDCLCKMAIIDDAELQNLRQVG